MAYFVGFHWIWLVAAAAIGLAMGWVAIVQRATGLSKRSMQVALVVLVAAVVLSVSHQIPGRAGYWHGAGRPGWEGAPAAVGRPTRRAAAVRAGVTRSEDRSAAV